LTKGRKRGLKRIDKFGQKGRDQREPSLPRREPEDRGLQAGLPELYVRSFSGGQSSIVGNGMTGRYGGPTGKRGLKLAVKDDTRTFVRGAGLKRVRKGRERGGSPLLETEGLSRGREKFAS